MVVAARYVEIGGWGLRQRGQSALALVCLLSADRVLERTAADARELVTRREAGRAFAPPVARYAWANRRSAKNVRRDHRCCLSSNLLARTAVLPPHSKSISPGSRRNSLPPE